MIKTIIARLRQGHHTIKYPDGPPPELPERFRGRPVIKTDRCKVNCRVCTQACPTDAITLRDRHPQIDMGKCLFCSNCINICPEQAIVFSNEFRLAARHRRDLLITHNHPADSNSIGMDTPMKKVLGRSLKLRQVSAGGCNACEADTNVLNTLAWDLGRFGIQFVASPRHADGLLITGPVTQNMHLALKKTYEAVPEPKIVIAVGTCAISGGPYSGHEQVKNGANAVVPVDLYIPGCPPHPLTILDGLIRFLDCGPAES